VLEWGFDQYTAVSLLRSGQPLPVQVQVNEGPLIQPVAATDLKVVVPKSDASGVKVLYDVSSAVNGPVTTGEPLGRAMAENQGQVMTEVMAISPVAFTAPHSQSAYGENAAAPPSTSDTPNQGNQ
jgi:D-alanyl-D-alanine carboxypeptidase